MSGAARPLLLLYAFSLTAGLLVLAYTRSSSVYRWPAAVAFASLVASMQTASIHELGRCPDAGLFTSTVWVQALKVLDGILINRVSFQRELRTSWKTPILSAAGYLANYRGIGTSSTARNVPPFSTADLQYVPSLSRLVTANLLRLVLVTAALIAEPNITPHRPEILRQDHERVLSRITEVSFEEMGVRIVEVVRFCIRPAAFLQLWYSAFSIYSLTHFNSEPRFWPHLFGSVSEAYNVRRVWE